MANVVVSAIATFNGKALTKGQKQIKSFEKSVKSLGRTFGIALSAAALVNFSKKAINAFVKDEAAAKSLELQLKNTGYAFSAPDVEYFIANMQKLYGVLDDQLRPAFQTLLTASGSITKSQKALNTVLNVSAATGKSVEEVSAAVAKGFNGQTTALTRLGAGLSKATLATGDMDKIMGELDAKFAGQATARLETYAGKMDQLKVAGANASEIIGKDLLDSLSAFSKDDTLKGFDNLLSGIATKLAGLDKAVFGFVAGLAGIKKQNVNFTYSLGAGAGTELAKIQEKKKIKEAIALRTQENSLLKAKTAVDQLRDKFDVERIGLYAALNATTDEEIKLRLRSQIAILDNNEALAKQLLAQMNAKKALDDLAGAATSVYQAFGGILNSLGRGGDQGPGQALQSTMGTTINNYYNTYGAGTSMAVAAATGTNSPITVNVNTPGIIETTRITELVQEGILRAKYEGRNLNPAGGL